MNNIIRKNTGHNKLSQLVYAASSTDADTVFVAGKKVVEAGKLLTFDEEKIYAEAEACTRKLLNKQQLAAKGEKQENG